MKSIFTLLFLFGLGFCNAQGAKAIPGKTDSIAVQPDAMVAMENEFDFGKLPQGKPVDHNFMVKNIGNKPYVIENVLASCGCTTPNWSKEIIQPGAASSILVGYNAAVDGPFSKTITIFYNGNQTKTITIKGDVWKTPVSSAPGNPALEILKNQH